MSYCRTSSDNGKSDFYIFGSRGEGGKPTWEIMVAANRTDCEATKGWTMEQILEEMALALEENRTPAGVIPIDHPLAGQGFICYSPGEAADKAEEIAAQGFHLPRKAVERLRAEQAAMSNV